MITNQIYIAFSMTLINRVGSIINWIIGQSKKNKISCLIVLMVRLANKSFLFLIIQNVKVKMKNFLF